MPLIKTPFKQYKGSKHCPVCEKYISPTNSHYDEKIYCDDTCQQIASLLRKLKALCEIKKLDYNMIVFNGHGSPKSILGHKNEKIISADENHYLLKDRIIYARSCWSVMELGEKCVRGNKNGCFIGYRIPFMFIIDTTRATNPLKDNTARIFFETSNFIHYVPQKTN